MTYLALGDSYTIGEQVAFSGNFPNQVVQLLRKQGMRMNAAEIIAKTGWATDELRAGISQHQFLPAYDFVSLLIGVNNQYRGRSADEYAIEFEELLKQAIRFAGNNRNRVVVLSIPDWGVTPFAAKADGVKIKEEIDHYNSINREIALQYGIHYIYITDWTREAAHDPALLAADGLHPSAQEYARWAAAIAAFFTSEKG